MDLATDRRLRILLVDLSKRYGGADLRVLQTATELAGSCDVAVVVLKGSVISLELEAAGVKVFSIPRSRHDPRITGDLKRIAKSFQPDVIDSHNPQSQLWATLATMGSGSPARLATVHSVYRIAHRGVFRQRSHEAVLKLAKALGSEFLVVSHSVDDYLGRLGVDRSRIHLVLNGIGPLKEPAKSAGLRVELGLAPGDFLIGIIGRIEYVKGHDVLVEAVRLLRDRGLIVHVAVVGTGSAEAQLLEQLSKHGLAGQIHLVGFRRDIPEILVDIDALCIPSRSEGLPYAVLEAAREGVPIVSSSANGLAQVFDDGLTALLFPPEDASSLATAIEAVCLDGDLRRRLGEAGRNMVATQLSLSRMVNETLAVYRALVARTAAPT